MSNPRTCLECPTVFTGRSVLQVCCSRACAGRRRARQAMAARDAARAEADAEALRVQSPGYRAALESHQRQLRRIWSERGLPLDELLDWEPYRSGFTAMQTVDML